MDETEFKIKKCSHCGNPILKEQIKDENIDYQGFLFCDFCLDFCKKNYGSD